ncbi:GNAT family N-acetyltransferase [Paenibacillus sp. strain BS8-2]
MIRARKPQDDPELVRLIRTELIPQSATARPLDARMIRELPQRFRWGVTYVAARTKQGPPVAFVHFLAADGQLMIDMLATNSAHQGLGYGSLLMAHAESYGVAHQCSMARLFVDASNGRAQRFYGKLGYTFIRYLPQWQCFELAKPLLPIQQLQPPPLPLETDMYVRHEPITSN